MSNFRLIHNNAADRATIVASTTAGGLTTANLKNDRKNFVHRSTEKQVTFELNWPSDEAVGGIVLPASNLSPEAEWQATFYNALNQPVAAIGPLFAAPGAPLELISWGSQPLNANAFSYGGATKSAMWLEEQVMARRVVIEISDPKNKLDYIDNARLVVGQYWQPKHGAAQYGANANPVDMSSSQRSQSGDNRTDVRPSYDTVAFDLAAMQHEDRDAFSRIIKSIGVHRSIAVSVLPDNYNPVLTQDWLIYGKRDNSGLNFGAWDNHSSNVTIQGW